jgi:hypothetical protein
MKVGVTYACYESRPYFETALGKAKEFAMYSIEKGRSTLPVAIDVKIYRQKDKFMPADSAGNAWNLTTTPQAKFDFISALKNKGIKQAYDDGCDVIIQTDDDVIFNFDTITAAIRAADSHPVSSFLLRLDRDYTNLHTKIRVQDESNYNLLKRLVDAGADYHDLWADRIYVFRRDYLEKIGTDVFAGQWEFIHCWQTMKESGNTMFIPTDHELICYNPKYADKEGFGPTF